MGQVVDIGNLNLIFTTVLKRSQFESRNIRAIIDNGCILGIPQVGEDLVVIPSNGHPVGFYNIGEVVDFWPVDGTTRSFIVKTVESGQHQVTVHLAYGVRNHDEEPPVLPTSR